MKIDFKVVCGAVGALVAGAVGYFVGRRNGRKNGYKEALERYVEANPEPVETIVDEPVKPPVIESLEREAERIREEYSVPIDFGDVVETVDETIESYTKPGKKKKKHPYIIESEDAGNEYSLITLHFHRGSNSVTNEDDTEELANAKSVIGYEVLNELESYAEPLTMYVRNENLEHDYEVICVDGRWGDDD